MTLPAAKYDRKIAFRAVTQTQDAMGAVVPVEGSAVFAWAAVTWGTAAERRSAGAVEADQAATFRVRSTAALRALTTAARIEFDGHDWGITGIASVGPNGSELEFTVRRWRPGQAVAA